MSLQDLRTKDTVRKATGSYLTQEVSTAIRIVRVLCIALMMFAHVWPGATKMLSADVYPALHLLYVVLIDDLARGSVPLLSIISGLMFYRSVGKSTWIDLLASKTRTLLVPMAAWSGLLLIMYIAEASVKADRAFFEVSMVEWINRVFSITGPPINLPLGFLRDIFVCCGIALLATRLEVWIPLTGRTLIVFLVVAETYANGIIMLRPQILMFFGLGYMIALHNPRSLILPWSAVVAVTAIDQFVRAGFLVSGSDWQELVSVLHRTAIAMLMWKIAVLVTRQDGRLRKIVESWEPLIFLVFCSHMLFVAIMAALFSAIGIRVTDPIYPLLLVVQMSVIFLGASLIQKVGDSHAPGIIDIITGGTLSRPKLGVDADDILNKGGSRTDATVGHLEKLP